MDMINGIFVTGTDTGIGKTIVTAALTLQLRDTGLDAVPMKAVQTGCHQSENGLTAPDLNFCIEIAAMTPTATDLADMCPYRYEPACSPHLAADLAGERISIDRICDSFNRLRSRHDLVVIEGAGGILVPLTQESTMLDLMICLRLPVLLVARPGLGTINHTLMSVEILNHAGLDIAGIVLNASVQSDRDFIEDDNVKILNKFTNDKVRGTLPFMQSGLSTEALRSAWNDNIDMRDAYP